MLTRRLSSLALRSSWSGLGKNGASLAATDAGGRCSCCRSNSNCCRCSNADATSAMPTTMSTSTLRFRFSSSSSFAASSSRPFSSDAVADDSFSSRLSDPSLLQTGAFIGGEFVTAGAISGDGGGGGGGGESAKAAAASKAITPEAAAPATTTTTATSTYDVVNPATARVLARVARCGGVEATVAVEEAAVALAAWRGRPARERAAVLSEWGRLIAESAEDLATVMSLECGKPLAEARNELASAVDSVHWSAAEAVRVQGSVLSSPGRGRRMLTLKQPVGVAGLITPWNFPASMVTRKAAPALAAGCTVVLKPAEATPLSALALAELSRRAGIPPGVFNVVSGEASAIGEALLKSDAVRKIGFTGSTAVGRHLYEGASKTVKRLSLELGGNAPVIVCSDADVEAAAAAVSGSAFRNAGQTCISASRVMVDDKVYDSFVDAISRCVARLRPGPGTDPSTSLGPLITRAAAERARAHVEDAVSKGATVAGTSSPVPSPDSPYGDGFFAQATVLAGAQPGMRVHAEETFGPVVAAFRFSTMQEAVALANDTEYGLAAYAFTRDVARAWRLAEQLEYGMVGINSTAVTDASAPFGGLKHSGLGKEGGREAIEEYLDVKTVALDVGPGLS